MADLLEPFNQFDNDFEQLSHRDAEDIVSSTSAPSQVPDEVGSSSHVTEPEPDEAEPLISFGVGEPPVQPPKSVAAPVAAPSSLDETDKPKCHTCCSVMSNIDPKVMDLFLWRDVKKSGTVFVSGFSLLLSLALFSIISVISYSALIVLTITVTFRLYKAVMGTVQKSSESHPFKNYLDFEINLSEESVHHCADMFVKHGGKVLSDLRHYIFIEDMIDSLKFALLLWILTYIGSWFNGMTLIILGYVWIFSAPKLYELYKEPIDNYMGIACTRIHETYNLVQDKIPFLGKKKQE